MTVLLTQLLNKSKIVCWEFAWHLQSAALCYWWVVEGVNARTAVASAVILKNQTLSFVIVTDTFSDNGNSEALFITTWIDKVKVPQTLVNGGSLIEIIVEQVIRQFPIWSIHSVKPCLISLINSNIAILDRAVLIPVNFLGIWAMIKVYILKSAVDHWLWDWEDSDKKSQWIYQVDEKSCGTNTDHQECADKSAIHKKWWSERQWVGGCGWDFAVHYEWREIWWGVRK